MTEDNDAFLWLGGLVWIGVLVTSIALLVLAAWGLYATAVALSRGEAWAQWVAGVLFLAAFVLVFREINKR